MNDTTTSLYEHIKNRLAVGYNYGDDGQTITDGVPDHRTSWQSIREDCEGDVGIFEYLIDRQECYDKISSHTLWRSNVQITVVCVQGDIEAAKKYLLDTFENINNDSISSNVYINMCKFINLRPTGKNKNGLQMVIMNIQVFYYINSEDD